MNMDQGGEVIATLNTKQSPAMLTVTASLKYYAGGDVTRLKRADPQGINPTIFLVNGVLERTQGPMKGSWRRVTENFELSEQEADQLRQVQVVDSDGSSTTGDIQTLG